ncbi:TIGR01841 family phasin [Aromatoleum evansii]|uniref:TIGR01841 family phasin n=1 Tax=Aromatoleum evansii TaxID=59406 RepID=UPI00145CEE08|nr:TIGR01841 family phasin [Aromatoleum evansii]
MNAFAAREQFAFGNQVSVEILATLANQAFTQVERLTELNLNTARSVLDDSVAATKTVLAVKPPQDLLALQGTLAQPMLDRTVVYGRGVYEIAPEGQQEIAKLFEVRVAQLNKTFTDALDKAAKSAPTGSEALFAAFKSAVDAANNVFDSVSKATTQATEIAEATVTAASAAVKGRRPGRRRPRSLPDRIRNGVS